VVLTVGVFRKPQETYTGDSEEDDMTGRKWVLVVALVAATLLRPPGATGQEACGTLRDEGLVLKVQAKLQFSPLSAKVGSVVVTSRDCVVTLAGTVPESENVVEAERIAASVPGVRRVRNTLRVESRWETAPERR
jgi:BON domain